MTGATEQYLQSWRRLLCGPSALSVAQETRVGTTPCDVVHERGNHRLLRYRRQTPARWAEPVLFCYALVNRPYILDLLPDKSVVRHYLNAGFDVYLIDWGVPSHDDRRLTLEHHVCGYLKTAVEQVLAASHCDSVHLLGYCMGGTFATILSALHPELVRSLTLLAAPLEFSGRESLLNVWTQPEVFDVDAFVQMHGNCPAWFLQGCFQSIKPVQNIIQKGITLLDGLEDDEFLANYFAMELWVNDNIPVAGETFRQFVKELYQRNRLARGELKLGDHQVDPARIVCPLRLLMAKNDHLVPPSSTEGIVPYVGSRDVESSLIDAGHVGLVVGGKAQRTLWPQATSWLAERSSAAV